MKHFICSLLFFASTQAVADIMVSQSFDFEPDEAHQSECNKLGFHGSFELVHDSGKIFYATFSPSNSKFLVIQNSATLYYAEGRCVSGCDVHYIYSVDFQTDRLKYYRSQDGKVRRCEGRIH